MALCVRGSSVSTVPHLPIQDSTNCGLCSTVVFTTEKNLVYVDHSKFKLMLFKCQLYFNFGKYQEQISALGRMSWQSIVNKAHCLSFFWIKGCSITFATQGSGRWTYVNLKYNLPWKQIVKVLTMGFLSINHIWNYNISFISQIGAYLHNKELSKLQENVVTKLSSNEPFFSMISLLSPAVMQTLFNKTENLRVDISIWEKKDNPFAYIWKVKHLPSNSISFFAAELAPYSVIGMLSSIWI